VVELILNVIEVPVPMLLPVPQPPAYHLHLAPVPKVPEEILSVVDVPRHPLSFVAEITPDEVLVSLV
jgi:hypothetical protein